MIIFATVFGVGFFILVLSLLFGGHGDVHVDLSDDADFGGHEGPSVFSFRMVALLMVGFGAVGFGCRASTEMSMFESSMAGIAGALGVGGVGYLVLRMFYVNQASSVITDGQIVGQQANVIDAISESDLGQVACVIGGREFTFLARSDDHRPIPRNGQVKIVGKSGNIVTVVAVDSQIIRS